MSELKQTVSQHARIKAKELYTQVKVHLLKQNKKSVTTFSNLKTQRTLCRYRGDYGMKCAIGAVIPDEIYKVEMEGGVNEPLIRSTLLKLFSIDKTNEEDTTYFIDMCLMLQQIHDNYEPEQWPTKLYALAVAKGFEKI